MITLTVIGIIVLGFIFGIMATLGGILVIFIDPIIAVIMIWLIIKLIKWIKLKLSKK